MKAYILLTFTLLAYSCNQNTSNNAHATDDQLQHSSDSINHAKRDSLRTALAAVRSKTKALLNRNWELGTFVDNFGDPTHEKYLISATEGIFSNSATQGSYLWAEIILTKKQAGILLHEYRPTSPPNKFIGGVQIQMKNEKGEKIVINTSGEWNQSGGIKINNYIGDFYIGDFKQFKSFLDRSSGNVKVVIRNPTDDQ